MEHTVKVEETIPVDTESPAHPTVRVLKLEHVKTNKKTSSRGTRRLKDIDRRVSKALRRVTRSLDHGVDSYSEHRDKSSAKKKDGPVVDFAVNVSYGVSKAISEASPLLTDLTEALNTRSMRTQMRRVARTFGSIPIFG
jgi:hypothetical protein